MPNLRLHQKKKGGAAIADYQEMYLYLTREVEKAVRILIEAQRAREELYIKDGGPLLRVFPPPADD